MYKLFLTSIVLIQLSILTIGQTVREELSLIPAPKNIEMGKGTFEFSGNILIRNNGLENIGSEDFTALLKSEFGLTLRLNAKGPGKIIRMEKRQKLGFKSGEEGYLLDIRPDEIRIAGQTEAGIFYGLQTLSQLITANRNGISLPCCIIRDYPDIPIRGWQDDISRGPIPTLDFLKKEVLILSSFKVNAMTLYTEQVFKLKKHPTLAPEDGITAEQIAELSTYAAKYHVQVIGNFQSFGHMEKILSKPGYEHLAEAGNILTPTKEESYQFLKEVYSEIVPAYSSPYFNVNCDETFGLGEGLSKKMADSIGIPGIYGYHINRLNELLKPYKKQILMWGDIASDPKIVALLPRDITVISWGYHDAPSFDYAIKPFSDQGLNFWVAPGVSCWGVVFPNFSTARVNISNYIRDGYRLGATGVLNTTWDDDALDFFENNWYPLAWGAEKSWNPGEADQVREKVPTKGDQVRGEVPTFVGMTTLRGGLAEFDKAFDQIFFGTRSTSVVSWMNAFSALHQETIRGIATNARIFEPVIPFYPEYVDNKQPEMNSRVIARLDSLESLLPALRADVQRNRLSLDYLAFALNEVRFTATKNIFRVDLYHSLNGMDGALAGVSLEATLKLLVRDAEQLGALYSRLWKYESRDWWLNRNVQKFGQLAQGLRDLRGITLLDIADTLVPAGRAVTMRSVMDKMPVFYTLDGTEPTPGSARYTHPIYLIKDATIRARVFAEGRALPETADSLVMHKAIGRLYKLNSHWSPYHPAYEAGGKLGLLDGRTGSVKDIRSGRWQGFSGQDINVEIDFGHVDTLHTLSMGFYQHTFSWVILPKQLDIYYSQDGVTYQKLITLQQDIPVDYPDPIRYEFQTSLNNLQTRYLKVVGVYYGPLPDFHASRGQESMMFADEIIVK